MINKKFPNGVAGYSYHNHSNFSDGKNSPEEMLLAAKAAGMACIALDNGHGANLASADFVASNLLDAMQN